MSSEIAIEKALLLGQVRPPDEVFHDDADYFSVVWRGRRDVALAWSEGDMKGWGTNWRLHHFPKGENQKTIRGFPAVFEAVSDPAFRKRYGIEPMEK